MIFRQRCLILFFLLFASIAVIAQKSSSLEHHKLKIWQETKSLVPIQLILPGTYDSTKKYSLLLAFHGFGDTAENFKKLSQPFLDKGFIVAIPEASYSINMGDSKIGYDWFLHQPPAVREFDELRMRALRLVSKSLIPNLIAELKLSYDIGEVYLLGFSQGGIVAYHAGITNHELITGMIIFGSLLDAEWIDQEALARGKKIKTLIFQGNTDQFVPSFEAENTRDLLIRNGYDVTFRSFEGGHQVPIDQVKRAVDWIRKNKN